MSPSCDSERSAVQRYVEQLPLRTLNSRRVYRCILNGFQCFVTSHTPDESVSRNIVELWLHDRAKVWPMHLVIHRAVMVDRFLDWQVLRGIQLVNPIAQLRRDYGPITTTAVIRALLADDPDQALDALRPPQRFGSCLGPQMRDHVALMQAVGHRYLTREACLLRFDRFLQGRPDLTGQKLSRLVSEWEGDTPTPQHAYECEITGRALAKALHRLDPSVPIPPWDPHVKRRYQEQCRHPHIFSEEDVRRMLDVARHFPAARASWRPRCVYLMLVLAYCAGLRVGEITRLTLGDLDLAQETIEIRETKFFKSRRLPLASSVMAALREYLEGRRRDGAPTDPSAALFWHPQPAGPYSYVMVGWLLREVIRQAGFKPEKGRVGPRIHDLRHTFVVQRMQIWYREGINPQSRLPYLATYLGHRDINSTLVYLTITQELLQQASQRFHTFAGSVLDAPTGEPT